VFDTPKWINARSDRAWTILAATDVFGLGRAARILSEEDSRYFPTPPRISCRRTSRRKAGSRCDASGARDRTARGSTTVYGSGAARRNSQAFQGGPMPAGRYPPHAAAAMALVRRSAASTRAIAEAGDPARWRAPSRWSVEGRPASLELAQPMEPQRHGALPSTPGSGQGRDGRMTMPTRSIPLSGLWLGGAHGPAGRGCSAPHPRNQAAAEIRRQVTESQGGLRHRRRAVHRQTTMQAARRGAATRPYRPGDPSWTQT